MRAGALRKQVSIQKRDTTIDAMGGIVNTWSEVDKVWAGMEPSSGKELLIAEALHIKQPTTITIRYQSQFDDPRVLGSYRIVYNSRLFNMVSVINTDMRNREIVMIGEEGLINV